MGKKGRIVAVIGAVIGIVCVLFSLIIPQLFAWYCVRENVSENSIYLTAFGTIIEKGFPGPDEIAGIVLIGGIFVLVGAGFIIFAVIKEMKPFGIIGGILMILGPLMLIFDLLGQVSEFAEFIDYIAVLYDGNVFFSYIDFYGVAHGEMGLYFGYPIIYAGGVLGLIGGTSVKRETT